MAPRDPISDANFPELAAAALSYRPGDGAPRVVAKGRGYVAEEILKKARAAGVFVHESRELVSLLMQVDLDRHIPAQLYVAVAELLAWLHSLDKARAEPHTGGDPRRRNWSN